MEKLEGKSMDLEKHSIEKIKELFPEVVTEGRIDFDKLRLILVDEIDESIEKYQFTWNGKSQTIKLAQKPSTGTLRPAKEESKNWDTTENLYIEGDNLEVLKQLQKTYFGKIKMIYIDPPYNTGGDFVYKDDFKDSIKNYKEQTNQTSRSNADTSGRYHTDWLNMMYPRLMLAKNLLSEDGVIFISIDDHELFNLKQICDSVFGLSNFVGNITRPTGTTTGQDANKIGSSLDYCLVYSKSSNFILKGIELDDSDKKRFSYEDDKGKFSLLQLRKTGNADTKEDRPNMFYPVISPDNTEVYPFGPTDYLSRWRVGKKTYEELVQNNMIFWKENNGVNELEILGYRKSKWVPYVKYYLEGRTKQVSNLFNNIEGNKKGSLQLKKLFGSKGFFDNPKPLEFLDILLQISTEENSYILDFFSGSATTAHAVMKLNVEDGGNRKFITVQLPEKTDEKSEAYKAGYKNICEIGKERIRRAGEQIKQEMEKEGKDSSKLDIGFKVFKLDETNIKEWDSSQEVTESTLFDQQEVFKEGRTTEDVLYEILLKYGVFDMPVSETLINDKVAYDVGRGDMIVALFDDITSEDVKAISEKKPRVVIFKDSGFANDNVKLNALHNLEKQGVEDIKSI